MVFKAPTNTFEKVNSNVSSWPGSFSKNSFYLYSQPGAHSEDEKFKSTPSYESGEELKKSTVMSHHDLAVFVGIILFIQPTWCTFTGWKVQVHTKLWIWGRIEYQQGIVILPAHNDGKKRDLSKVSCFPRCNPCWARPMLQQPVQQLYTRGTHQEASSCQRVFSMCQKVSS